MAFEPKFTISSKVATALMKIEASRQAVQDLPITPTVLATLRETARRHSTHHSTAIEGNRLTQEEVSKVIEKEGHFPGRERDEKEVLGYYAALENVERHAAGANPITERQIQIIHALAMAGGKAKVRPSRYRDGQNVIRDSRSRAIVYLPPTAKDVPPLMGDLIEWLRRAEREGLPCPIRAGVSHYQYATIHPYYDGNGRTARLLTTLVFHLGGYDLKGLYSLEEYYARDLGAYYRALTVGPSHNYYLGRAEADITPWIEYFCGGAAESFERVKHHALEAAGTGAKDFSPLIRRLDPRQRKMLSLFRGSETVTSRDIAKLFTISQRTARVLLAKSVADGFLAVADPAKKSRIYALAGEFGALVKTPGA